jgi:endoglycosylceramidase
MDYMQELGINVVRLGVMWAGAEPIRNQYDAKYFEVIHGIIQRLATRGIYTLVDVHQDVMSKQFCGEGFPDWFASNWKSVPAWNRFPFPQQLVAFKLNSTTGIPDPWDQCNTITDWFISYLTVAVGNAFGQLYKNDDGLGDSFSNYWGELARQYKNYSSVLGYDLMNEPWAGDIYVDPTLLVPGVADQKNLEPLWNNATQKIREVDNTTIVFFEGVTWDIKDGHRKVPGGDGSKAAMSYHYYAPPQFSLHTTYANRIKDQDRLKTGGMLTEFQMWAGGEAVSQQMRDTVDLADYYLQSWMGWEFSSFWNQDQPDIEKHYARTYAPAVAGFVSKMEFNEDTADYSITWKIDTSITAPTEIKINKRIYYPDGFTLTVIPADAATYEVKDTQNIHVKYTANAKSGQDITVQIVKGVPTTERWTGSANGVQIHIYFLTLGVLISVFAIFH